MILGGLMEEDISKRTITVLVALTVLISLLGTLSVMNAVNEMKSGRSFQVTEASTQGQVSLNILPGEGPKGSSSTTGMVALSLLPPIQLSEETV